MKSGDAYAQDFYCARDASGEVPKEFRRVGSVDDIQEGLVVLVDKSDYLREKRSCTVVRVEETVRFNGNVRVMRGAVYNLDMEIREGHCCATQGEHYRLGTSRYKLPVFRITPDMVREGRMYVAR